MNTRKLERDLYLAQRTLGDVRAARRGSDALAKRLVKRTWHRQVLRVLRKGGMW